MAFATINSSALNIPPIEEAFAAEPSLKQRVYDTIGSYKPDNQQVMKQREYKG
jgi:hypothetical protein